MAEVPLYFPAYASRWLGSQKIGCMTPAEEGAYFRLLCLAWVSPDCDLPDNDDDLAILSRLGEGWLKGASRRVRGCFVKSPTKPGRLINTVLVAERQKYEAFMKNSRKGGIASGKSRGYGVKGGSTDLQPPLQPKGNRPSSMDKEMDTLKIPSSVLQKEPTRGLRRRVLPEDFQPSEKHAAIAKGLSLNLAVEYVKFKDHHQSKGSVMLDWDAALRKWLRNAVEFRRPR